MAGFDATNMRVGKRKLPIQHMTEAVQDFLAATDKDCNSVSDRGKAVTFDGSNMKLATDGDEIVGFIEGVELPNHDGRIPIGVRDHGWVLALDSVGRLTYGDLVVSAAQSAFGTHPLTAATNNPAGQVKKGAPATHKWVVWEVYGTGANRPVLLRKV